MDHTFATFTEDFPLEPLKFQCLATGWGSRLEYLVRSAERSLRICAPFVTQTGIDLVVKNLPENLRIHGSLTCLTDLSPLSCCQGATEPTAIRALSDEFSKSRVVHLPRLHAKIYIADEHRAIVSSGNLTAGGVYNNYEYGIEIKDEHFIARISEDLDDYSQLGAQIGRGQLDRYCELAERARRAFKAGQAEFVGESCRAFREAIGQAEDELIRARLNHGATNIVFAKTILYLLKHHGALGTEELHPLIEQLHPDLCDNSIDRVIDGKSFGKKWKHAVRSAQQLLKRRKEIELRDGKWILGGSS